METSKGFFGLRSWNIRGHKPIVRSFGFFVFLFVFGIHLYLFDQLERRQEVILVQAPKSVKVIYERNEFRLWESVVRIASY